ncbi:hypothetical protein B0H17DRAFT_1127178 [Mycena rosella]|uniref:Uncharacterized protein n=1 Tax=Mycena rosella TaxID=1033263 RepID=A0AAD7GNR4_MYCRO|nr:hypothetical protein B0H17DRAFT_1127178 [Mycena rosella]
MTNQDQVSASAARPAIVITPKSRGRARVVCADEACYWQEIYIKCVRQTGGSSQLRDMCPPPTTRMRIEVFLQSRHRIVPNTRARAFELGGNSRPSRARAGFASVHPHRSTTAPHRRTTRTIVKRTQPRGPAIESGNRVPKFCVNESREVERTWPRAFGLRLGDVKLHTGLVKMVSGLTRIRRTVPQLAQSWNLGITFGSSMSRARSSEGVWTVSRSFEMVSSLTRKTKFTPRGPAIQIAPPRCNREIARGRADAEQGHSGRRPEYEHSRMGDKSGRRGGVVARPRPPPIKVQVEQPRRYANRQYHGGVHAYELRRMGGAGRKTNPQPLAYRVLRGWVRWVYTHLFRSLIRAHSPARSLARAHSPVRGRNLVPRLPLGRGRPLLGAVRDEESGKAKGERRSAGGARDAQCPLRLLRRRALPRDVPLLAAEVAFDGVRAAPCSVALLAAYSAAHQHPKHPMINGGQRRTVVAAGRVWGRGARAVERARNAGAWRAASGSRRKARRVNIFVAVVVAEREKIRLSLRVLGLRVGM